MFNRISKATSRRILKSAIFLSLFCFAFVGCENPASAPVKEPGYLESLTEGAAKQYKCRVDSLGREYVGQYRPNTELQPEKTTKYIYTLPNQETDLYDSDYLLIDNANGVKNAVTCQL